MAGLTLAITLVVVCVAIGVTAAVAPRVELLGVLAPDALTTYGLPAVKGIFDLAAALTIGWLLAAALFVPPERSGAFTVGGFRAARAASLCGAVWTAAGLALVPLIVSDASGRSLLDVLGSSQQILGGVGALESARAPLFAALGAVFVAILARVSLRPGGAVMLLLVAIVSVIPVATAGHAAQAGDHDLASDSMIYHLIGVSVWVGGLVALIGLARQRVEHLPIIARRYSTTALIGFVAVTLSGVVNAWIRFSAWDDLFVTDYGRLVLAKTALLVVLGVFGFLHRRRTLPAVATGSRRPLIRLAVVESALMAATMGVAVALGRTASPPPSGVVPSNLEETIGFDLPGPPTIGNLLFAWRFDLVFGIAALLAVGLYLYGVRRLKQREIAWPVGRTVTWCLGWLSILLATSSGFGRYGIAQFSIHMIDHMVLGMIAPILLVLGGPVTLALRVLPASRKPAPPGMRELIVRALHSPVTKAMTHPLVVFALFIVSFFAVYFTPVFGDLMESHLGHLVMELHFLLVGYLYYWVIIGVDPAPRRLPPILKLGLLLAALPFHAFFGLAMMNNRTPLAADYYRGLALPWVGDLVSDQKLGGAIAWGATEVPIIIVVIALMAQWSAGDAREATRTDRATNTRAEADLDAYNAMLAEMAFQDVERDQAARNRSRTTATGSAAGSSDSRADRDPGPPG